ncbi:hypothetical protein BGLA2_420101 [Burkholderia gladioli]|nr:hypothetical protein BGLA2_420101 [Burkholderia gladioli]
MTITFQALHRPMPRYCRNFNQIEPSLDEGTDPLVAEIVEAKVPQKWITGQLVRRRTTSPGLKFVGLSGTPYRPLKRS